MCSCSFGMSFPLVILSNQQAVSHHCYSTLLYRHQTSHSHPLAAKSCARACFRSYAYYDLATEISLGKVACFSLSWARKTRPFCSMQKFVSRFRLRRPSPWQAPMGHRGQESVLPAGGKTNPKSLYFREGLAMFSCSTAVLVQPMLQQLLNWL